MGCGCVWYGCIYTVSTVNIVYAHTAPLSGVIAAAVGAPYYTGSCVPLWQTPSTTVATIYALSLATTVRLTATPIGAVTYTLASGTLPPGSSLSSGGVISGFTVASTDTLYTFTVRATGGSGLYADRVFSIQMKAQIVQVFTYTGADQTWTTPASVRSARVYLWGGAGGGASGEGYSDAGGAGGYAEGYINLTGFTTLTVQVGGGGLVSGSTRSARAYPAGGLPGIRNSYASGGGGGRSAINRAPTLPVIVAGGGGGAAGHGGGGTGRGSQGGCGGTTTSENGYSSCCAIPVNTATQTTSNIPGSVGVPAQLGGFMMGADAGSGLLWDSGGNNCAGGGGDGFYGGA